MNNSILNSIYPENVFYYFEEICGMPHGSSNTKIISDYLRKFGEDHGLRTIQDSSNNVIIFKDGTKGYENSLPVILQGHMDMVCECENDRIIDFANEGLKIFEQDGYIRADRTTLGADDGIAVAIMLAILDSDSISHPPIEAVFTVDEEIGMLGAAALDMSVLSGRRMINIDNEEEGYLLSACAGGATVCCNVPVLRKKINGNKLTITINGLTGGHSGQEIDKYRANASVLMARLLYNFKNHFRFSIISLNGGLKDNAIARQCVAEICIDEDEIIDGLFHEINKCIGEYENIFKSEFAFTDPGLKISAVFSGEMKEESAMSIKSSSKVIDLLYALPAGIQRMCPEMINQVQTSLNLGILTSGDNQVTASYCVRSSVATEKQELIARMKCITELFDGEIEVKGDYPAWEYVSRSEFRNMMSDIYEEMFGCKPVVYSIHAGVECGLFSSALDGLECVSIGPDIKDIHTPNEALSIESTRRTYDYILEVLKKLK